MEEYCYSQSFRNLFSYSAIIFIGLVESHETSETEPIIFRFMNLPRSPQAATRTVII